MGIFIYCSTQINTKNAPAEYHMIEDYIKYSNMNLDESKVLTNSMGAILYISKEWDLNKSKTSFDNNNKFDEPVKERKNSWNKKEYEYNEEKSEDNIFLDDTKEEPKLK